MDGTEWKIGSFQLHVLVLAAQVKGIAIPVYFKVYEHKGVLSENERIKFIRKSFIIIDLQGIYSLQIESLLARSGSQIWLILD